MKNIITLCALCALIAGIAIIGPSSAVAAPGNNNGGNGNDNGKRMTVELTDYRFRNDDGTETGATWMAAPNTPVTLSPGDHFRLRVHVAETAGVKPKHSEDPTKKLYWQQHIVGEGDFGSLVMSQCDTVWYDDSALWGDDTTEQFESPSLNYIVDNDGLFDWNSSRISVELEFAPNRDVELEACLVVPTVATPGDVLEIKMDGAFGIRGLDGILNMPTILVQ